MLEKITYDRIPSIKDILCLNIQFIDKYKKLRTTAIERKEQDSQLAAILSKDKPYENNTNPASILKRNYLPGISTNFRSQLRLMDAEIDSQFIKNWYVYVFRGDYPNLTKKGLYSYRFQEININLDQMLYELQNEPLLAHCNFSPNNKLEEFMWIHSNGGCENFLSTTTDYNIAKLHPKYKQNAGTVYVLKIPVNQAFKNYASVVSSNEEEILVVDYILADSIIETIDPNKYERVDIRDFM